MKPKSLAQLILFILVVAMWLKIAWPMMTREAAFFGAIGGLLVHWALTNKGNKNIVYIKPLTAGWRVLLYDIMFVAFLVALIQQDDMVLLDALRNSVQNLALLLALVGGIFVDYSVGG